MFSPFSPPVRRSDWAVVEDQLLGVLHAYRTSDFSGMARFIHTYHHIYSLVNFEYYYTEYHYTW